MSTSKTFCPECREYADYTVKEKSITKNIKNTEVECDWKETYCNNCKEELLISEIHDKNLERLDNAYRELEGLIKVNEIEKILNTYNIGKKPLASLLGWGETTIIRYVNGDIPTKQYSDVLKKILNEPEFMYELLGKNKENISSVAYNRCEKALNDLGIPTEIAVTTESIKKIDIVAYYLITKCEDITNLALQKLLYYSQGFNRIFNEDYIFEDDCQAWVHGPVYKDIYSKYRDFGYNSIEDSLKEDCFNNLTTFEKDLLDNVIDNLGCYSGKILEEMTHIEEPWRIARKGLADNESSTRIIKKENISDYFYKIKEKYKMINVSDIRDYSVDLFNKVH